MCKEIYCNTYQYAIFFRGITAHEVDDEMVKHLQSENKTRMEFYRKNVKLN